MTGGLEVKKERKGKIREQTSNNMRQNRNNNNNSSSTSRSENRDGARSVWSKKQSSNQKWRRSEPIATPKQQQKTGKTTIDHTQNKRIDVY